MASLARARHGTEQDDDAISRMSTSAVAISIVRQLDLLLTLARVSLQVASFVWVVVFGSARALVLGLAGLIG